MEDEKSVVRLWDEAGSGEDVTAAERTGKASCDRKRCVPERAAQADAGSGNECFWHPRAV